MHGRERGKGREGEGGREGERGREREGGEEGILDTLTPLMCGACAGIH